MAPMFNSGNKSTEKTSSQDQAGLCLEQFPESYCNCAIPIELVVDTRIDWYEPGYEIAKVES